MDRQIGSEARTLIRGDDKAAGGGRVLLCLSRTAKAEKDGKEQDCVFHGNMICGFADVVADVYHGGWQPPCANLGINFEYIFFFSENLNDLLPIVRKRESE